MQHAPPQAIPHKGQNLSCDLARLGRAGLSVLDNRGVNIGALCQEGAENGNPITDLVIGAPALVAKIHALGDRATGEGLTPDEARFWHWNDA